MITMGGVQMNPRQMELLIAAAVILSFTGCKKASEVSRAAYIVGPTNDIKKMGESERKEIPASVYNASVLIATQTADKKIKFCSGTLIAGNGLNNYRVLTNHHCFAKQDGDGKAIDELLPEACTNTRVYFGYYAGHTRETATTGCLADSIQTNFNGDLGIFTLSKNPPLPYLPLQLWDGETVPEGRKAYIVHYPDIAENLEAINPTAARLPVAAVTTQDCKVSGLFDPAEWDLDRTLPYSLRHTCDLIHGSSGSALVDAQTSTLIGVNWGGIKITYASGTRVDNVATRIDFIKAFLENRVESFETVLPNRRVTGGDNAVAGTTPNAQSDQAQSTSKKRKSICGVVNANDSNSPGILMFLVIAILPFALVTFASQRHKH
jgi:V8-like Glu-specific endopeptidase